MAKYILEIQSRYLYPGPREDSFSELFEAKVDCEWSDDNVVDENEFDLTFVSDRNRYSEFVAIDEEQKAVTGVNDSDNYHRVRNGISIYPMPGFDGSLFKYTVSKKVPIDGNFKYFGMEMSFVPMTIGPEFYAKAGTISNPWE